MAVRDLLGWICNNLGLMRSKKKLSFVQLLEEDQPYQQFDHLHTSSNTQIEEKDREILSRIEGCLIGLAVGDALGATVEFRPNSYLKEKPVEDMQSGGTWGLSKGQWTDDTSMALCLAASLIVQRGFNGYDQMLRYWRWHRHGYLSSTKICVDIGRGTRMALNKFQRRREKKFEELRQQGQSPEGISEFDRMMIQNIQQNQDILECASENGAGNGSLMRLAPIPIYYYDSLVDTLEYAKESSRLTHSEQTAIDACRFYAMLIHQAINGVPKDDLLNYEKYDQDFLASLHPDIQSIAKGSYKVKDGYDGGIRGSGYVVLSLEAALWAFSKDDNSFEKGALAAVNLGDDTDTTAAIYGQLAGATYGIENIPESWRQALFQSQFILSMANELFSARKASLSTS